MAVELNGLHGTYSKANGCYVRWDTDVNLSPAKAWRKPAPEGDQYLLDYYNLLQYTLFETGHPETIDRTGKPRKHPNKECVNVAMLSSPAECIGLLLEGGKQLPDGFHLVLSPSWLSKVPSEKESTLSTLLLHKSISFHSDGTTFIDEFEPPRRVTYFVNNFTDYITHGQRNDGVAVESNVDCPVSNNNKLCEIVDDKVWTRDIMAEVGMEIPETIAFRRLPARELTFKTSKMNVVDFKSYALLDKKTVEKEITTLITKVPHVKKVVVKSVRTRQHDGVGASIHEKSQVSSVVKAVEDLLMELDEGSSVLVEEFVEHLLPLKTGKEQALLWSADETLGVRVRATVCRDHDDTPVTTLINCLIAEKTRPINGENSVFHSLDSTLLAFNITDMSVRQQLEQDIRIQAADVLRMIWKKEKMLNVEERGQTDVIGIDMIVTMTAGKLVPIGIGVESRHCLNNTQIYDFVMKIGETMQVPSKGETNSLQTNQQNIPRNLSRIADQTGKDAEIVKKANSVQYGIQRSRYHCGDTVGQSIRPLVRNFISRSQREVIKGNQLLVIGGGGVSKKKIWPDSAAYGVKIILVDADPNFPYRDQVYRFIHYDIDDHQKDFEHANGIVNLLHKEGIHIDGSLTFWEDCVPLAALLNELTGTKGSTYKAALTGKKKSRTLSTLYNCQGDIPHWPRTYLYSSKSIHIKSESDCNLVSKNMQYPVILKLEHGSSGVGVSEVNSEVELKNRYHDFTNSLQQEADFPGIGLGHDNSMVAMDLYEGVKHDIDVVIYDRKLVGAFVSESGPTRRPSFITTAVSMPSSLPADKQAQLIAAAYQCCTEIGLTDGSFNVEMMMTKKGPKLIEINARMGGFCRREWIKIVYGVDLMFFTLLVACGIKPCVPKHAPDTNLIGVMLVPSLHSHVFREKHVRNKLIQLLQRDDVVLKLLGEDDEEPAGEYEEPLANITVLASTKQEVKIKILDICRDLGIDQDCYQVDQFIKYF